MVAFAGGRAAGGLADALLEESVMQLEVYLVQKKEGPLHMFAEISKDKSIDANRLAALGGGISDLALGLKAFGCYRFYRFSC